MSLINKEPKAILEFCPIIKHWSKAGGNKVSDFTAQSLTLYVLNTSTCASTFHHSELLFALIAKNFRSLSFLQVGKAVVSPFRITVKCIVLAMIKLTLSFLKNIEVWSTYAIKSAY